MTDMSNHLIDPHVQPTPAGYRETNSGSGLLVPEGYSRVREVWTDDEIRLLNRATKTVNARGWYLAMTCPHERCREKPVVTRLETPGGFFLQCQHKQVVCLRASGPKRRK